MYGTPDYVRQNEDVVTVAIANSKGSLLQRVQEQSKTPSEKGLEAVLCLVPLAIRNIPLQDVKPGYIVALNVDFYIAPPVNYANYFDSYEKFRTIERLLDQLCILSIYRVLQNTRSKPDTWEAVAKFLKNSGLAEVTVSKLFQLAVDYLLNRLTNQI